MDKPLVSIIMGVYNCEQTLSEAIESIITQSYTNWEFIICDDGSNDYSYEIAVSYKQRYPEKFLVLKNEKNMGLNYTLNHCLSYTKGEYIARMDGDDLSLPSRFFKQVEFLKQNKDVSFVSSTMIFFDEKGDWGCSKLCEQPTKRDFLYGSPFSHAPCMLRKKAYVQVDGYTVDKKLLRVEDYHLWIKLYEIGLKGYNFQEPLYKMFDGRDAYARRTFRNRVNEFHVKIIATRKLQLGLIGYIYALRPLVVGLLPSKLYDYLHKKKLNK